MKIYHISGYAPAVEAAKKKHLKPRTLHDQVRRHAATALTVDKLKYFPDGSPVQMNLPEGASIYNLQWVGRCARQNKIVPGRIYEQIILGNIPGITIGGKVFVIPTDPDTVAFLKDAKIR
ncbi:MAG: hypothetical protein JJE25_05740 [Bacteroidia bacterium]|nr:hypothetical protein [Bacteroidia bacterium]